MTAQTYTARHGAKRSAFSHLRELSATVNTHGRKGPVVAASSGLALTMVATAAGAVTAPAPEVNAQAEIAATTISEEAQAALAAPTSMDVAADSEWTSGAAVKVETTKAPAPVVRSTAQAQSAQHAERQASARATRSVTRQAPGQAQPAPVETKGFGAQVVAIAMRYIGTPYVHGGASPAGFDCSGFTQYVYAQMGISLPRSSSGQRSAGRVVPASEARPGDLMWWPGHVGIYLGNGQHIAARNPGTPLKAGPIFRGGATFIRLG